jgi:hypothetical protein
MINASPPLVLPASWAPVGTAGKIRRIAILDHAIIISFAIVAVAL